MAQVHAQVHVRTLRVFDSESGDEVRPDLDGKRQADLLTGC
jgi:hypothetical protein